MIKFSIASFILVPFFFGFSSASSTLPYQTEESPRQPRKISCIQNHKSAIEFKVITGGVDQNKIENIAGEGLTGNMITSVIVKREESSGMDVIELQFNEEGSNLFAEITGNSVGKQMAIVVDGVIVSTPYINQKITGGTAIITGLYSYEEAIAIAEKIC